MPPEKFTQVLPQNWDGRFPFTNDSDEDFVFVWAKKAYLFPAHKTVDMMRMAFNATPLEVQQIRKFAAKKWAEREFFKSAKYESMRALEGTRDENGVIQPRLSSFTTARSYDETDLKDGIQRCLTPLPEGEALVADVEGPKTEEKLHKDDKGNLITPPIEDQKASLDPGGILIN